MSGVDKLNHSLLLSSRQNFPCIINIVAGGIFNSCMLYSRKQCKKHVDLFFLKIDIWAFPSFGVVMLIDMYDGQMVFTDIASQLSQRNLQNNNINIPYGAVL